MTYDGGVERRGLGGVELESRAAGLSRGSPVGVVSGAPSVRRRLAVQGYRAPFGRFLGLSLTAHALIVIAGLTGGAAYVRRGGVEQRPASFTFPIDAQQEATAEDVSASAEPEREVETERDLQAGEGEVSPLSEIAQDEAPLSPGWELLASAAAVSEPGGSASLDQLIGDPRNTWRLPSAEAPGLHVGHVHEPPISECCGEPQPAPSAPPEAEIYVYPKVVKMAPADFPLKSQRLGEDGSVLLEMTVGVDGLVKDVRVAQSSGYSRIDNCAVAAAWKWIFEPATRDGVPEVALARHRYTFRITGSGG